MIINHFAAARHKYLHPAESFWWQCMGVLHQHCSLMALMQCPCSPALQTAGSPQIALHCMHGMCTPVLSGKDTVLVPVFLSVSVTVDPKPTQELLHIATQSCQMKLEV